MPDLSAWFQTLRDFLALAGIDGTPKLTMFTVMFGGMFTLSALIMLLIAAIQSMMAITAKTWPTTMGTVQSAHIASSHSSDGTSYRPIIRYQYQVGETYYINDMLAFGSRGYSAGHGAAAKKVAQYPPGSSVTVHYKPGKPERAVLETRSAPGCLLMFLGILFLCIGVVGGIMGMFMPA